MFLEDQRRPGVSAGIDPLHRAVLASLRPLGHGSDPDVGGHFRAAFRSGAITGTDVDAGDPLFALQWTSRDFLFVLLALEAWLIPTVVFTGIQEIGVDAIIARNITAAATGGTALSVPNQSNRARALNMQSSRVGDLRIADTNVLTAGTYTVDTNPFEIGSGIVNWDNADPSSVGDFLNPVTPYGFRHAPGPLEHPIVLAANEGLLIRDLVDFPAAGTVRLHVKLAWAEVPNL